MINADLRSAELIKRTHDFDYPSVAEVGVYRGDMSRRLMYRQNLHLLMVDPWGETIEESYKDDPLSNHTTEEWAEIKNLALSQVSWAKDRVRVYQGTSEGASAYFDEKFDIVFLDGDHSYKGCSNDIRIWWDKVSEGGYLGGHDYGRPEYGVTEAVNEFAEDYELEVVLGQNFTWWVQKK
jgi:hypothetical protein